MHPTLMAMLSAEREVDIARAAKRRSHANPAPLARPSRSIEPTRARAAAKTALAHLVSRPVAAPRTGTAGPEVCCA
jgi:hypothetical protein